MRLFVNAPVSGFIRAGGLSSKVESRSRTEGPVTGALERLAIVVLSLIGLCAAGLLIIMIDDLFI